MARITSPLCNGRLESPGAFTTRTPSLVPKYSPRSGLRLTNRRSPQGDSKKSKCISGMTGIGGMAIIPGSGMSITKGERPSAAATSVAFCTSVPRRTSTCTVSPGSSLRASAISFFPGPDSSSSSDGTPARAVPLNLVMTSPTLRPALSAGPPGVTASILAPILSVSALASVRTITPTRPRLSSSAKAKARGGRGGRGGRGARGALGASGGSCARSRMGHAASATAATSRNVRCMSDSLRGLEPHVRSASHADAHQLLHEIHPLLPQLDELGATCLRIRGTHARQHAVDDGNAVLQGCCQRSLPAARHAALGVIAPQLLLERRRLLLHAGELR